MARELGDYNICVNTVKPGFRCHRKGDKLILRREGTRPATKHQAISGRNRFGRYRIVSIFSAASDFTDRPELLNVDGGFHFV